MDSLEIKIKNYLATTTHTQNSSSPISSNASNNNENMLNNLNKNSKKINLKEITGIGNTERISELSKSVKEQSEKFNTYDKKTQKIIDDFKQYEKALNNKISTLTENYENLKKEFAIQQKIYKKFQKVVNDTINNSFITMREDLEGKLSNDFNALRLQSLQHIMQENINDYEVDSKDNKDLNDYYKYDEIQPNGIANSHNQYFRIIPPNCKPEKIEETHANNYENTDESKENNKENNKENTNSFSIENSYDENNVNDKIIIQSINNQLDFNYEPDEDDKMEKNIVYQMTSPTDFKDNNIKEILENYLTKFIIPMKNDNAQVEIEYEVSQTIQKIPEEIEELDVED